MEETSATCFIMTVEWNDNGHRGIFCDKKGVGYCKDELHTEYEMQMYLGPPWSVLSPKSELMTESEIAEHCHWVPLAEYDNAYGIALKKNGAD